MSSARHHWIVRAAAALSSVLAVSIPMRLGGAEPPSGVTLVVEVAGLRNYEGQLLANLFTQPRGFPEKTGAAQRSVIVALAPGRPAIVRFEGLVPGTYAVAVVHDENGNQQLDTGFFGIPREGFATSNNVQPTIGAPSFAEARFVVTGDTRLRLQLLYY